MADIVIAGAGIIGCAAAVHLPPPLDWQPGGYLFIVGPRHLKHLAANFEIQQAHDVDAYWLEPADLAARYPQLRTEDLAGAVLSPRDGWLDPGAFFAGVRAKAERLGAAFVTDRVTGFARTGTAIRSVTLQSGRVLAVGAVVNAAGTWGPALAAQAGMPLPVEPMRRHVHYLEPAAGFGRLPFIKDPAGLAIHPCRQGLSVGLVDFSHPGGDNLAIDEDYYDCAVAPALAHRLPGSSQLTLRKTWAGLYDQNRFDGNMIIGNWPGHLDNFYTASGFSGHGLMHALGTGRALAELIISGEYATLDLSRMGYQRIIDDHPYPEHGIR